MTPIHVYRNNFSLRLYLHHQVHIAFVIITGHRRVRTDDQLPVYFCRQIDMLPWKGKCKQLSVVISDVLDYY